MHTGVIKQYSILLIDSYPKCLHFKDPLDEIQIFPSAKCSQGQSTFCALLSLWFLMLQFCLLILNSCYLFVACQKICEANI